MKIRHLLASQKWVEWTQFEETTWIFLMEWPSWWILAIYTYRWFHLATAKICWHWWKLRFCNRCEFLPFKNNFLKFFVHIFGFVSTRILNLSSKKKLQFKMQVFKTPKYAQKFSKSCFYMDKNLQWFQNRNFHQCQQIFDVAG